MKSTMSKLNQARDISEEGGQNMARLTTELRKKVMRGAGWKCERCGIGINSLTGEIHLKNGNHDDNRIGNLQAL